MLVRRQSMFWLPKRLRALEADLAELREQLRKEKARFQELNGRASSLTELEADFVELREQLRKQKARFQELNGRVSSLTDIVGAKLYPHVAAGRNPQEIVWEGRYGFRYIVRHLAEDWHKTRVPMWSMFFEALPDVTSVAEFGCNIGANLKAIHYLNPDIALSGIEINPFAVDVLSQEGICEVHCGTVSETNLAKQFDLVFSRGVLMHLNPETLPSVFANLERHARKYLLIWEPFSKENFRPGGSSTRIPGAIQTEGYTFWNDFAGEFLKSHSGWSKVMSGVNFKSGVKPRQGKLHWTILKRNEM